MARPKLSPDLIEKIKAAPLSETAESVGLRLGVSGPTVKKYRKELRQERQEAAREVIAEHVQSNVPDALKDLSDLREMARAAYQASSDPKDGTLWLNAIKTTLEHVRPDDAELDAAIAAELAGVEYAGQATPPRPYSRAQGAGCPLH